MVGLVITAIYFIGIPLSFWLGNGFVDFEHDEDENPHDRADRYLSIAVSVCIALCWPIFWGACIAIYLMMIVGKRLL